MALTVLAGTLTGGHEVRLMSLKYVRSYVTAQKNNDRDAGAIAEAAARSTMQFAEPGAIRCSGLHRVRSRLVAERTTLINQLCAVLLERCGIRRRQRGFRVRLGRACCCSR